jgi:outer membrane protein
MKSVLTTIQTLAIAGIVLFAASCQNKQQPAAPAVTGARIAYINIDTLEEHFELLKQHKEEFRKHKEQMEGELQQSAAQMQAKAQDIQKKAQAQTLTQSEYEAAQKQYMNMQQSLESRNQALTEELMKQQDEMNKDLKKRLDAFLETYNKDKHYDFILSYSKGGGSPVMYANKQYEITNDVIAGMNAATKDELNKKK